jgi:NADH-quinone oxidoreductase subunit I
MSMQAHADSHAQTKHADAHGHAEPEDFHQPPVPHGGHDHHAPALPLWLRVRSAIAKLWVGIYLPSIFAGLAKSFQWMVRPKTTELYPEVKPQLRKGYRGEHRLKKEVYNGEEREKCVACYMCATACPAECITIIAEEAPWPDRDKRPKVFEIDLLKCIYCGMCEEACPCDAIELTTTYTQVATSRKEKVYDKERLLRN